MKSMKNITTIVAIVGIGLILLIHKGINGISIYNAAPLVLALVPVFLLKNKARERQFAAYGFSSTAITLVIGSHLLWALGANSSSTGGIMFVFLPLYAIVLACVGGAIGTAIGLVVECRARRRPNQAL
jgi:hypothetical protein